MKTSAKLLVLFSLVTLFSCSSEPEFKERNDFKTYYDDFQVEGCFVLHDPAANQYLVYQPELCRQTFLPASTFKICNTLIGLETGVLKDEHTLIHWDSVVRRLPAWNTDQDLLSAFRNSTVWYYQELARRVGGKQMKHWLDTLNYGNADTSGGIDRFWLDGGLRISPMQQIDFLQSMQEGELPVSQHSLDVIRKIMVVSDTNGYVLRAKTGWGGYEQKDLGWYVGYLEKNQKVYYFANCIFSADTANPDFARARIEIVNSILKRLKLIVDS